MEYVSYQFTGFFCYTIFSVACQLTNTAPQNPRNAVENRNENTHSPPPRAVWWGGACMILYCIVLCCIVLCCMCQRISWRRPQLPPILPCPCPCVPMTSPLLSTLC